MTSTIVREQNLDKHIHKQMGCMAGFLNIFDRHQILAGKRISSAKRLPPPQPDSSPEPENHVASPARPATPSPERVKQSPAREHTVTTVTTLPVLEFKEGTRSTWKFSREAPRLSLDSRTRTSSPSLSLSPNLNPDDRGEKLSSEIQLQRRSTSVVARLMGLESLPGPDSDSGPNKKPELRRSASESRASRDLNRFFDAANSNGFQLNLKQVQQRQQYTQPQGIVSEGLNNNAGSDPVEQGARNNNNAKGEKNYNNNARNRGVVTMVQKKSFFDSADFFPEVPKRSVSIYGEIERRLRMRGIDEPSKDLETLKHILEALQLKGLLHSKNHANRSNGNNNYNHNHNHNHMNFVLDGGRTKNDSPIVVIKPVRSNRTGRTGSQSPPNSSVRSSPRARRNERQPEVDRRSRNARSPPVCRSPNRRNVAPNAAENHHHSRVYYNDGFDSRKVSPVQSPRVNSRRTTPVHSPRMRKPINQKDEKVLTVAEDESSTVSESSFSTSSHTDTERYRLEEYKEGRNLLDRCDKLLNSIAEMTASNELQPSPVSVLDSSFYRDEWCLPSPITKRCIDYKDQAAESEDDMWSAAFCSSEAKSEDATEDNDFSYVSEILKACTYLPENGDVFALLEKQQILKGKDTSKASTIQRRLVFDTVRDILSRHRRLPPWKVAFGGDERQRVWSEFRRIRGDREEEEEWSEKDMFEVICGVLRKDMAEDVEGWGEWTVEIGDMVLDIERLVFKDLIGETIRELATCASSQRNRVFALRRKLVF
ncbi:uncharacterized protein [Arachis hypogaea]|uniref:DUF4378 domain-containing protein n=1 Tax=Arachis hypogaea TaxID=3818 RepID=A0A445EFJ7_ARAHY|nr:protein LONGIFOLIA 1 [Arachis hypogaea]QHO52578.1 Protein LONGIFOLIA [Arachis hypogaea]RYR74208.1 hypothetical protein Ahy_A02g008838 [Arachis hypogaea]